MIAKAWLVDVLLAAIAGAAIWVLSPTLAGHAEPWDAESVYYPLSLLVIGVVLGGFRPRRPWAHYLGVFAGQLIFMLLFLPLGALVIVGVVFLALYSLITFAGSFAAMVARKLVGKFSGDADG